MRLQEPRGGLRSEDVTAEAKMSKKVAAGANMQLQEPIFICKNQFMTTGAKM